MFSSSLSQFQNSALFTEDQAKEIAKSIFYHYDRNRNGVLDDYEISSMMTNNYKFLNKQFSPSSNDLTLYKEILDTDIDKKISLYDFEQLCLRYFAGVQNEKQSQFPSTAQSSINKQSKSQSIRQYNQKKIPDVPQQQKQLTKKAKEKLEASRKLFRQIDVDKSDSLTDFEVKQLLVATYKQMDMNYNPSESDIKQWMDMTDTNSDGQISLSEFEALVLKSLEFAGVQIYE